MGRSAEKWSEQLWNGLITKISQLNSKEKIRQILEKLISENEKRMILRRLTAIALISSGKSYKEIGEILWLSPNTVSTIKKNILGNHKSYKSYRLFYGGLNKWSHRNLKSEKSSNDALMEIITFVGKIFEPFLYKGIGVKGDKYWQRGTKK